MNYKKISFVIRAVYAVLLALVIAVVVVAELDLMPVEGTLVGVFDAQMMYIVEVAMLFLVGVCILLALKGFDRVLRTRMSLTDEKSSPKVYVGIYCVRLALLTLPMLMGVYYYYGLLENQGLYCALAAFVASFFCLPSAEGVEIEMSIEH